MLIRTLRYCLSAFRPKTSTMQHAHLHNIQKHFFGLSPSRFSYFQSKKFWITGAGTGYGRAIAHFLSLAGATVIISGRRRPMLQKTVEEAVNLGARPDKFIIIPMDVTNPDSVRLACKKVISLDKAIACLINNAALPSDRSSPFPLLDNSLETWERTMKTNLIGPWLLCRTMAPHMAEAGSLRILNVSSFAGWAGTSGGGIYNVSKAALNSLTFNMACEFEEAFPEADVQVNAVIPGEALSEMNRNSANSPERIISMTAKILSTLPDGPNGYFFSDCGLHLEFCTSRSYPKSLG